MAEHVDQHSEVTDPSETPIRHERPEDWGWHAEWGRWARVAGWISVVLLLAINFTWHYNNSADPWMYGLAALLVLMLVRDRFRRKNAWRD